MIIAEASNTHTWINTGIAALTALILLIRSYNLYNNKKNQDKINTLKKKQSWWILSKILYNKNGLTREKLYADWKTPPYNGFSTPAGSTYVEKPEKIDVIDDLIYDLILRNEIKLDDERKRYVRIEVSQVKT